VTFTATVAAVAPGLGTPDGTVTFTVDGVSQGDVALSGGQASFSTAALGAGDHTATGVYNGAANVDIRTSAVQPQTVHNAHRSVAVTSSGNRSVFGQSVTFTATVSAVAPGAGLPAGSVTFTLDGVDQATVGLINGQASFSTSALAVGGHTLTVSYGGDGHFNNSASAAFTQTVNKAKTTTAIASAPNPSGSRQSVTLTPAVSVAAPGARKAPGA